MPLFFLIMKEHLSNSQSVELKFETSAIVPPKYTHRHDTDSIL